MDYKRVSFDDLYIGFYDTISFEEWMAKRAKVSINEFLDIFAFLVHTHQHQEAKFYARKMGVPIGDFLSVIRTFTGLEAREFICKYVIRSAKELLSTTNDNFSTIATTLNFRQLSIFSRLFRTHTNTSPSAWRRAHRKDVTKYEYVDS